MVKEGGSEGKRRIETEIKRDRQKEKLRKRETEKHGDRGKDKSF